MKNKLIIKLISLATLLLICSVVVFTYIEYNNYRVYESRYMEIYNDTQSELNTYIKSILLENKKKAEIVVKLHSIDIHKKILKKYESKHRQLQKDIFKPSETSALSKIFDKSLDNVYINSNNNSNKVFVISSDKILWNRYIDTKYTKDLKEFSKTLKNTELCNKAFDCILNMKPYQNFIFWEINSQDKKYIEFGRMDIDKLIEGFNMYGLEWLKKYEILIPVYITDNGDIFGTRDFNSLGEKIKNYKIIIIQRMNIYDALKSNDTNIMYFQNNLSKIKRDIFINKKEKTWSVEISLILIVFILLISGCLQNKLDDNENK